MRIGSISRTSGKLDFLRYFLGNPSRRFTIIEQKMQSAVSLFLSGLPFSNFGHKLLSGSSFVSVATFTILLTYSKFELFTSSQFLPQPTVCTWWVSNSMYHGLVADLGNSRWYIILSQWAHKGVIKLARCWLHKMKEPADGMVKSLSFHCEPIDLIV